MDNRFMNQQIMVRRKVISFMGAQFHIYDPSGQLIMFSKLKALKLREDIRLFTGEDMTQELLSIKARNIMDISAIYDVTDSSTGLKVGALKRRGLKSMLKDEWVILNLNDQEVGMIVEDSMLLALIRRILSGLIPQSYSVTMGGAEICELKQNFNPFVLKLNVDFSKDVNHLLDPRLGVAAAILIASIEGRQQ